MTAPPDATPTTGDPTAGRGGIIGLLARGGSWQAAAQLAPLVLNVVLTPIIIAGLGIDRYGLFLLVSIIASVLAAADGWIGAAALRFFAVYVGEDDRGKLTRLLCTTVLAISVVAVIAFTLFFAVARSALGLLDIPADLLDEGAFLLRVLIVITVVAHLRGLFAAVLNAHHRFALPSITNNVGYVIYIAGVLLTIHQGWGLYGIGVTLLVQQAVATVLIVPSAVRMLDRRALGLTPKAERKEFWRYALHTQWVNLMLLVTLQTDAIVVSAFLPVRAVALYTTGANFALQIRNVPMNAEAPIQSLLGQSVGSRGVDGARAEFERVQRLWVLFTTGWGAVAVAAAWFGITAWLGDRFAISGAVAVIMLTAYVVTLWAAVLTIWTRVLGHPEIATRSATVAALVNLVLTLSLVVPFGIIGTVVATAVAQVVSAVMLLWVARRRLPGVTRSFAREIPVLPAVAAVVVVLLLEWSLAGVLPGGAVGLLLSGLVASPGLALYAVLVFGPATTWRFLRARLRRPHEAGRHAAAPADAVPGTVER